MDDFPFEFEFREAMAKVRTELNLAPGDLSRMARSIPSSASRSIAIETRSSVSHWSTAAMHGVAASAFAACAS